MISGEVATKLLILVSCWGHLYHTETPEPSILLRLLAEFLSWSQARSPRNRLSWSLIEDISTIQGRQEPASSPADYLTTYHPSAHNTHYYYYCYTAHKWISNSYPRIHSRNLAPLLSWISYRSRIPSGKKSFLKTSKSTLGRFCSAAVWFVYLGLSKNLIRIYLGMLLGQAFAEEIGTCFAPSFSVWHSYQWADQ